MPLLDSTVRSASPGEVAHGDAALERASANTAC